MQRSSTTTSSASDREERDTDTNFLSKDVAGCDPEAAYNCYSHTPTEEMHDLIAYYRTKKNTQWCCRPINFQRWFIILSLSTLALFCFGLYVYTQAVDFEIHYVSGTSEMRENQRIGAIERGQRDLSAQLETVQRIVGALQVAIHETNPNYIFEREEKE